MSEGNIAADALRLFIERIERLEEEKSGIAADIKDVYAEAKSTGYDAATMRTIIRIRKMEPHKRQEAEALLDTYKAALGMDDMFAGHDGKASLASASKDALGEYAEHLADMDAKGIGISLRVGDGPTVPLNKTAAAKSDGDLYPRALELVIENQKASTSWLQRQLRVGYNVAARLIERMEAAGVVSAPDHVGKRTVKTADIGHALVAAIDRIADGALSGAHESAVH